MTTVSINVSFWQTLSNVDIFVIACFRERCSNATKESRCAINVAAGRAAAWDFPFSLIPSFKLDGMTSSALVNTGVDDMTRRLSIVRILPLSSSIPVQADIHPIFVWCPFIGIIL